MRWLIALTLLAEPALAYDETEAIVLSNAEHTLWHEAAHLLISELELPVIGQEEDAADSFATLMMLDDEGAGDERIERLLDVAELWIVSHERDEAEGIEPAYYDDHDLDVQRGLRVICFLAGEGSLRAAELVDSWGLPEDRAETCEIDYDQALDGWDVLLGPYYREGPAGQSVTVSYGEDSSWEPVLRDLRMLEYVAETLDATYALPKGLTVEAAACDEANAFWDPETRTVTLCYELLDDFEALADLAIDSRGGE